MEKLKKFAPWIIGGIILLYILSKLRSGSSVALAPQTQFTQTAQPDPFTQARLAAFQFLSQLGIAQIQAETQQQSNVLTAQTASQAIAADVQKANILQQSYVQGLNLQFMQRENDRQIQQSAIDRYYSSRNTQDIVNSVNQALGNIFSSRSSSSSGGISVDPGSGAIIF